MSAVVPQTLRIEARYSGVKRYNRVGEGKPFAAVAARGDAVITEIELTAGGPEERLGGRLSCCMAFGGTHMNGAWATPLSLIHI